VTFAIGAVAKAVSPPSAPELGKARNHVLRIRCTENASPAPTASMCGLSSRLGIRAAGRGTPTYLWNINELLTGKLADAQLLRLGGLPEKILAESGAFPRLAALLRDLLKDPDQDG
jgi:hypothetical protein